MNHVHTYQGSFSTFLKQFSLFVSLLIGFQALGLTLFAFYSQADLFLMINRLHHNDADQFFMYLTHLGDWPVTALLAFFFLFVNYRYALVLVANMLYTGFFTQLIKIIVQHPRPAVYFQHLEPIYTIKDYALQNSLSFPSGHTTCVFSLAISLSYLFLAQRKQPWLFLMALTVSISRVYLAQHFFKDLLAGSFIGTFFALHLLWLFERTQWFHAKQLDSNLLRRFKSNNSVKS
ncbi:hypothetical protein GCM10023231_08410 [Olivibacter ginsenosidimutans]|uniref:Phosphatidic acid phosphatase type 2/haloperoxidase domain-containing protein n=1 Tax=Olivibacter ginsenosidimutans TaxID=1176537 RepID=A0ABP9AN16_9SPHI